MESQTTGKKAIRILAIILGIVLLLLALYGFVELLNLVRDDTGGSDNASVVFAVVFEAILLVSGVTLIGSPKTGENAQLRTETKSTWGKMALRVLAIAIGVVFVLGGVLTTMEENPSNLVLQAVWLTIGTSLIIGSSKIGKRKQSPVESQPDETKKKRSKLVIILGIVLFLATLFFLGMTGFVISEGEDTGMVALLVVFVALLIAGSIPMMFGSARIEAMYLVNTVYLTWSSLLVSPWYIIYKFPGDRWGYFPRHYRGTLKLFDLFVLIPCLGAILFGILWMRKTQKRISSIFSWICIVIGGLGTLLFVIDLIRL